jgi:hypothetical protein
MEPAVNLLINVGLARADGTGDNTVLRTVSYLNRLGFMLLHGEMRDVTHAQGTERTLVAAVRYESKMALDNAAYGVAQKLGQDCIAVAKSDSFGQLSGKLYGPAATKWGEFKEQFFHRPAERVEL